MGRFLKLAAALVALLLLTVAVSYWGLGYRIRLDGSGIPRLVRITTPESQAAAVEAHRAAQQANLPGPVAPAPHEESAPVDAPPPEAPEAEAPEPVANASDHGPTASVEEPPYWTGFRGPRRDGHYTEQPIRTAWPENGLTPLWKQPIGGGYASFAVARGRAFTIEQRRNQEVVTAYDVATGRELWSHAWDGEFREWMGGDGPRATPEWADGRVYALGALGELRCLDEGRGEMLWRVNILEDNGATNLQWGMAASPLVVDDLVVVLPGGGDGRSIVAYDRLTGEKRWAVLDDKQAYSSPMLVTLNGRRQILVVTASRLVALVPETGELLWDFPWVTANDINVAQPLLVGERRILLSSAYGHGAAMIEVADTDGRQSARQLWESSRLKNRFSSSVVYEGFIYGLDETILTCLDAETGEVKWKAGRYGHGQFILASGHLIMLTEDGDLALIRATPERLDELVRFPVLEGKTWNHPAMEDGILLVRNLAEMAAFDLRVRRESGTR
jgi:outer membrane protein assembly factor BamB